MISMPEDVEAASDAGAGRCEALDQPSLPSILAPQLRQALTAADSRPRSRATACATCDARTCGVRLGAEGDHTRTSRSGVDLEPVLGLADNGDLETDLQDLLQAVGEAATDPTRNCMALFSRRTSIRGRGPAFSPDHGDVSSSPVPTASDDDRRRADVRYANVMTTSKSYNRATTPVSRDPAR